MENQFQISRIQYFSWKQFSGHLHIQTNDNVNWQLLFHQGKLIYAQGGVHPYRLWLRYMHKYCPNLASNLAKSGQNEETLLWQYQTLNKLVKAGHITPSQAISVINAIVTEVLFDLIQSALIQPLTYKYAQQKLSNGPLTLIETEQMLKQANEHWEGWRGAGLAKISPHLAPIIKQPEKLQKITAPAVYQNFANLLTGKNTLRDLSIQMNQDVLLVARSLMVYIRQGIIGLTVIQDLPKSSPLITTPTMATNTNSSPLIACVDDSPQTCQIMQQIFLGAGYRFVSIQNPVEALPVLLERRPDLIFLDLMMPVVNGYEICSQLRRVSLFANTPIIILTGNDGLIDRMRAKVVGTSDFLTKPVEAQKVLGVVRKYLSSSEGEMSPNQLQLNQQLE